MGGSGEEPNGRPSRSYRDQSHAVAPRAHAPWDTDGDHRPAIRIDVALILMTVSPTSPRGKRCSMGCPISDDSKPRGLASLQEALSAMRRQNKHKKRGVAFRQLLQSLLPLDSAELVRRHGFVSTPEKTQRGADAMSVDTCSIFKRPLHCLRCDEALYFTLRSIAGHKLTRVRTAVLAWIWMTRLIGLSWSTSRQ